MAKRRQCHNDSRGKAGGAGPPGEGGAVRDLSGCARWLRVTSEKVDNLYNINRTFFGGLVSPLNKNKCGHRFLYFPSETEGVRFTSEDP